MYYTNIGDCDTSGCNLLEERDCVLEAKVCKKLKIMLILVQVMIMTLMEMMMMKWQVDKDSDNAH
jgi:hypothetical protein